MDSEGSDSNQHKLIKNMNYIACTARYDYVIWDRVSEALPFLLEYQKASLRQAQRKGMKVAKQIFSLPQHTLDIFTKTVS